MTLRNTQIQAARTWCKAALGLTDAQIVPVMRGSTNKFMRLPLPYMTVNLTPVDDENGVDWTGMNALGEKLTVGNRVATLRLIGYGEETSDWLTELGMRLDEFPEDNGTLVNTLGPLVDVSRQHDEYMEHQYAKDFRLDYRLSLTFSGADNPNTYADTLIADVNGEDGPSLHLEVDT